MTSSVACRAWRSAVALSLLATFAVACRTQSAADNPASPPPLNDQSPASISTFEGPTISASDERVATMGRTLTDDSGALRFGYPGVTLRFCFHGNHLSVIGSSSSGRSRVRLRVDGEPVKDVVLPQGETEIHGWSSPEPSADGSSKHCAELVHQTETWLGMVSVKGFRVDGDLTPAPALPERKLLFVGDSVTCGEALLRQPGCQKNESWWDADGSYGALTARALQAQFQLVCFGGKGVVRDWQGKTDVLNAPQFFPLTIPDESVDAPWDMQRYVPDAVVISLGTNDFNLALGEFPRREHFVSTYVRFIKEVLSNFPAAVVFVTEGAIVNDDEPGAPQKTTLQQYLKRVVQELGSPQVVYVPATHYAGDTCDPHPTTEQHAAMAADLTPVIAKHLDWEL